MKSLAVIGAGGHGRVAGEIAELLGCHTIDFFDSAWPKLKSNCKWPVVGAAEHLLERHDPYDRIFLAIGDNKKRRFMFGFFESLHSKLASLVHPSSILSSSALVGRGTIIMANVVVGSGAKVGDGVILNTSCCIDHDCNIGAFSHVSPGVSVAGNVNIGHNSWIGVGTSIKNNVVVGANVIVGAGSAIVNDIPSNLVVAGVPAKKLEENK